MSINTACIRSGAQSLVVVGLQSTMDGMRTVSLPVEAAATSLPDSALAQAQKGSPLGDASAVGHTSIDVSTALRNPSHGFSSGTRAVSQWTCASET